MSEPSRCTTRQSVPPLNPEQQLIPLVYRRESSNTANMPLRNGATRNAPVSHAEAPSILVLEDSDEDQPPLPVPSIGSPQVTHPALPHTQPPAMQGCHIEEPIEGADCVEWEIHLHYDRDKEFQEALKLAADGGDFFDPKLLEGMDVLVKPAMVDCATRSSANSPSTVRTQARFEEGSRSWLTLAANHNSGAVRHPADGLLISAIRPQTDAAPPAHNGVGRDDDDALSIVAIGVQTASLEDEIVKTMKVGTRPSVIKVLDCLKLENDVRSHNLVKWIERAEVNVMEICTATRPMGIDQLAQAGGKWGAKPKALRKLEDILEPCINCLEVEDIRRLRGPEMSPSTRVFVLYIIEHQAIAGPHSRRAESFHPHSLAIDAEDHREASTSTPSGTHEQDSTLTHAVVNYLDAMIKPEDIIALEKHVLPHRGGNGAYSIIVFARLMESACQRINILYSTGNDRKKKHQATNGPLISRDDIVSFYCLKRPSEFHIAQSMFANH
ncbi:hypothetical protein AX14_012619 [Amanita brunnescens Koide BX004]|nr:hypothetical protein AX14_012619 [Amanita brunnescens Koide BX004]